MPLGPYRDCSCAILRGFARTVDMRSSLAQRGAGGKLPRVEGRGEQMPLPPEAARTVPLRYPLLLGACTLLFVLRVLGQVLVAVWGVGFLPPFEQWYSGLLPYPLLLPVQIAMIALMLKIVGDFARGEGTFVSLSPRIGTVLQVLGLIYFLGMVVRYVVTMALHPELRWFTGTIPIWFHMVLATFIFTLGEYQARRASATHAGTTS
jgi:hypothetical protein